MGKITEQCVGYEGDDIIGGDFNIRIGNLGGRVGVEVGVGRSLTLGRTVKIKL